VTWHEAAAYCNTLSKNAGKKQCYVCSGSPITCKDTVAYKDGMMIKCPGYRLPTRGGVGERLPGG